MHLNYIRSGRFAHDPKTKQLNMHPTGKRISPAFAGLPPVGDLAARATAAAALCAALCGAPSAHAAHALRTFPVAPASLPPPQLDAEHALAEEAWSVVGKYFSGGPDAAASVAATERALETQSLPSRAATYRALRDGLGRLDDRYSRLLTPPEMDALRKYDVSGVGLLLTQNPKGDLVVAAEPASGSPAAIAGVRRGDVLLRVDGSSVVGRGAFEVAQTLRGDNGTSLPLAFRNAGDVTLTRQYTEAEKGKAVTTFITPEGEGLRVGTVVLPEFSAAAAGEVAAAVRSLRAQGAEAVALDLRGNPGGVFQGALEVAGIFEGAGVPVAAVTAGAETETFKSGSVGKEPAGTGLPLAVVVDGGSASAAEVLAGGLRDQCRAAIVGPENSYGKGLIQGVFALSDGSGLVLTVARYETPGGMSIQGTGLTPDFGLDENVLDKVLRKVGVTAPAKVDFAKVDEVIRMCKVERNGDV